MLKLTIGVLAFVLASSASAAGWRSMRIDASSEASFNASVTALKDKLPRVRRHVFEQSLKDIWTEGTKAAAAGDRDYTTGDYLRELDGLGYKEVVTFIDSTGDTADRYWNEAYTALGGRDAPPRNPPPRGGWYPTNPPREAGESSWRPLGGEPGVNPWQQ